MKCRHLIAFILMIPAMATAQSEGQILSLDEVYARVENSFPLAEKRDFQRKISALNDQIVRSAFYPEIQLNADASYQSEVTELPISSPGFSAPSLSKDHYSASLDLSQSIYDGGSTKARRRLESDKNEAENVSVSVSMWKVRSQVEAVFFAILNLEKQQESVRILMEELEDQLDLVRAKVDNGVLLPGNEKVLRAELLKARQTDIRLQYQIQSSFKVLSELTGSDIEPDTRLIVPLVDLEQHLKEQVKRPELEMFKKRSEILSLQQELTGTDRHPKISAFAKGAYGRPGFNVFEDDLHTYWMVGIRARWSLKNWNNSGKKTEILELEKRKVKADESVFMIELRSELAEIRDQIEQLKAQINLDEEVLELREQVAEEKKKQLEQGVITSTEYVTELNEEAKARVNLEIRKLQLVQKQIEYVTKKGISWN